MNKTKNLISKELEDSLEKYCWYHGTDSNFTSWELPPPMKKNQELLIPHTGIFFTKNLDFAKGAGNNIATTSLKSNCKILDTSYNYDATEKLRQKVKSNNIASQLLNVEHDFWHTGWETGDVLRIAYKNPLLNIQFEQIILEQMKQFNIPRDLSEEIFQLNSARGLIELICTSAKELGYDAIFGYEVDRHSNNNTKIAQPWLAILSKNAISEPKWIT
jgi:hypothetical protein